MQLKAVVLPEPLGPISAVIRPAAIAKEQSSRARTPPNDLPTPLTRRPRPSPEAIIRRPSRRLLLIAHDSRRGGPAGDDGDRAGSGGAGPAAVFRGCQH